MCFLTFFKLYDLFENSFVYFVLYFCFVQVSEQQMQYVLSLDISTLRTKLHTGQLDPIHVLQCYQRKVGLDSYVDS